MEVDLPSFHYYDLDNFLQLWAEKKTRPRICIEAVAGAGKSFTLTRKTFCTDGTNVNGLVPLIKHLYPTDNVAIVTFSKENRSSFVSDFLPSTVVPCYTFHSIALKLLLKGDIAANFQSYADNISPFFVGEGAFADLTSDLGRSHFDIVKLWRAHDTLLSHFPLPYHDLEKFFVDEVALSKRLAILGKHSVSKDDIRSLLKLHRIRYRRLQEWKTGCDSQLLLDYTGILWLALESPIPVKKFDYICIDEAQDVNPLMIAVLFRYVHKSTKILAFGDSNQVIYAAHNGLITLQNLDFFRAPEKITDCFRCPQSHIEYANGLLGSGSVSIPEMGYDKGKGVISKQRYPNLSLDPQSPTPTTYLLLFENVLEALPTLFEFASFSKSRSLFRFRLLSEEWVYVVLNEMLKTLQRTDIFKTRLDKSCKKLGKQSKKLDEDNTKTKYLELRGKLERVLVQQAEKLFPDLSECFKRLVALSVLTDDKASSGHPRLVKFEFKEEFQDLCEIRPNESKSKAELPILRCCSIHRSKGLSATVVWVLRPVKSTSNRELTYVAISRSKHTLAFLKQKKREDNTSTKG